MMDINEDLLEWFITFIDKKTSGKTVKNKIISNKELAEEFTQTNYQKIQEKKSKLTYYRKYLGYRSSRCAVDK